MDLLDRLYQRLSTAAAGSPGRDAEQPLTIGEVYQQLIPYRSMRSELGVWELAAYEHALLRLFAGEGGYAEVTDEDVRRELQRELAAPNPILGVYRDYAGVRVRLRANDAQPPAQADNPLPTILDPAPPVPAEPSPSPGSAPVREPQPSPHAPPAPETPASAGPLTAAPLGCRGCRAPLPDVPELRYCPACGADQREVPCASCGTPLRPEWNFCIRCGIRREETPG